MHKNQSDWSEPVLQGKHRRHVLPNSNFYNGKMLFTYMVYFSPFIILFLSYYLKTILFFLNLKVNFQTKLVVGVYYLRVKLF